MKKVTVRDIAKKMGISKSTVSLALSNKYGPSDATRAEIMLCAREMNYDFSRREAATAKKTTVCVLSYKNVLTTSFWNEVFLGIEQSATEYCLHTENLIYDDNFDVELLDKLSRTPYMGVIAIDFSNENIVSAIEASGTYAVMIDPRIEFGTMFSQINASNYKNGFECAKYFYERGHRFLGFVGSIEYGRGFKQRFLGFKDFCESHSLKLTEATANAEQIDGIYNVGQTEKMIASQERPTAVMCANDLIASYVYNLLAKQGLRAGDDVSVIGFDNRSLCLRLEPHLTTFELNRRQMGKRAVQMIYESAKNGAVTESVELSSQMIERQSVKTLK